MPAGGNVHKGRALQRAARQTNRTNARAVPKQRYYPPQYRNEAANYAFGPFPGHRRISQSTRDFQTQKKQEFQAQRRSIRAKVARKVARQKERHAALDRHVVRTEAGVLWPTAQRLFNTNTSRPKLVFDKKQVNPNWLAYVDNNKSKIHFTPKATESAKWLPKDAALSLLHEWAHTQQPSSKGDTYLIEGGAESFARRAYKQATGHTLPKDYTAPSYMKFMRQARKKGPTYLRKGQFK